MNNKEADQTARMRRLVCACFVRQPPMTGFLASRPNFIMLINVTMPITVDILTFMNMINFMLSRVEHEKSFITSWPD